MLDLILLAARLAATIAAGAALIASVTHDTPRRQQTPLWLYVVAVTATVTGLSASRHLGLITEHTYSRAIGPVAVFVYVAIVLLSAQFIGAARRRRRFSAALADARRRPEEDR